MMLGRRCAWPTCSADIPQRRFACEAHWYNYPRAIRDGLVKASQLYRLAGSRPEKAEAARLYLDCSAAADRYAHARLHTEARNAERRKAAGEEMHEAISLGRTLEERADQALSTSQATPFTLPERAIMEALADTAPPVAEALPKAVLDLTAKCERLEGELAAARAEADGLADQLAARTFSASLTPPAGILLRRSGAELVISGCVEMRVTAVNPVEESTGKAEPAA